MSHYPEHEQMVTDTITLLRQTKNLDQVRLILHGLCRAAVEFKHDNRPANDADSTEPMLLPDACPKCGGHDFADSPIGIECRRCDWQQTIQ